MAATVMWVSVDVLIIRPPSESVTQGTWIRPLLLRPASPFVKKSLRTEERQPCRRSIISTLGMKVKGMFNENLHDGCQLNER